MGATNSAIFYPSDWTGEARLRQCSLAARGLWIEMLCLAMDAEEPGFVMIGPKPADAAMLARHLGLELQGVQAAFQELESWQVFSRDGRGWPYCRRMLRGQRLIQRASSGGRAAAKANQRDNKGKFKQAGQKTQHTTFTSTSTITSGRGLANANPPPPPVAVPEEGKPPQLELLAQEIELSPQAKRTRALQLYNAVAPLGGWVAAKALTSKREKALDATLRRLGLDGFAAMLEAAAKLRFFDCTRPREGKHANWRPDLDFFLTESKQAKITEGSYDRYGTNPQPLHGLTGGARLAALVSLGSLD